MPVRRHAASFVTADPGTDAAPAHRLLGLSDDEMSEIAGRLGRPTSMAELAMFSVMWSEHCSYKSSRAHLGRLPSTAPWVVVGPGENAGVVDLGDGWLAALRIESHNHPSFVEPHQGAATGVGGILRDVFTMGARPVALWDSIRFGPLDDPLNRYLFTGVVGGIASYGNAVGVPTVGGEVGFEECYSGNPLVNVMCLGVMSRDQLVLGTAGPPGSVAVLLGASTGRDGIGGASVLASAGFDDDSGSKRPSVQVGDPFEEKKLIEACLELYRLRLVVGVQDLGAAGLTCAAAEPAARAGVGLDLDLDKVHVRESGLTAPELLMSESQERMMAFVLPERVTEVLEVAARWEIEASVVGTVRAGGMVRVSHGGELVAEVPAEALSAGPRYLRSAGEPWWLEDRWSNTHRYLRPPDPAEALLALLDDPALGDRSWVFEQYDHLLFLDTVLGPGHGATLLSLGETGKGMAVSVDGNGRLCSLDPRRGAARLVFEAALNVAMVGARPLAVVDNLNFGNPEHSEVMWQFIETVEGIAAACEALSIPVVGGNVSFYNETDGQDIDPTPVIGLLGVADPIPTSPPRLDQAKEGMELWLLGSSPGRGLAGSCLEKVLFGHVGGRPTAPDPTAARGAVALARGLADAGFAPVLQDVADGGLAVAVAEICIRSAVGATVECPDYRGLFSEDPHRMVAAVNPGYGDALAAAAGEMGVPSSLVGRLGGDTIAFRLGSKMSSVSLETATRTWTEAIPRRLAH
jgi:phosphoribosylformylglycinamidine synthase subunit PurL